MIRINSNGELLVVVLVVVRSILFLLFMALLYTIALFMDSYYDVHLCEERSNSTYYVEVECYANDDSFTLNLGTKISCSCYYLGSNGQIAHHDNFYIGGG